MGKLTSRAISVHLWSCSLCPSPSSIILKHLRKALNSDVALIHHYNLALEVVFGKHVNFPIHHLGPHVNGSAKIYQRWKAPYWYPSIKQVGDVSWRSMHNCLASLHSLSKMNPQISSICPFCGSD